MLIASLRISIYPALSLDLGAIYRLYPKMKAHRQNLAGVMVEGNKPRLTMVCFIHRCLL
jgi:hypothetical protein